MFIPIGRTSTSPCQHISLHFLCSQSVNWKPVCTSVQMAYSFVRNKYFLSLSSTPTLPAHPLAHQPYLCYRFLICCVSTLAEPAVPLRDCFTHGFHCCVAAVLCLLHKHIDHFQPLLPLSPFFCPGLKIHFHKPIRVRPPGDHLQSSFLFHPLTPSARALILFHISI